MIPEACRSFHIGTVARHHVTLLLVSNGGTRGCVIGPTQYSLLFVTMVFAALSKTDAGIIHYRYNGRFFDLGCLKARTKALMMNFVFDKDYAFSAYNKADLQNKNKQ